MKSNVILGLYFLGIFLSSNCFAAEMSGDEVLKKSENYRGFNEPYTMTVKIENFHASQVKESATFNVMVKSNTTSLAEQVEPSAARGRKLLMIDNDMWLHTPDIKKAIRINLEQKLTGETANGDIAKTNFYGDYEPKILEKNDRYIKMEMVAKVSGTTYRKIIYFVNSKTFVPVKADFLAASGKLLKTAVYGKVKKISGKEMVTEVVITDGLQKKKTSRLTYTQMKREKLDDSIFNRSSL